jgi:hypothetical protein
MGSLPKSLERNMCLALIQWMGITTTLPVSTHQWMQAFPSRVISCAQLGYKPRHLRHTHTYLVNPTFSAYTSTLPPEGKIPTHSTHSIFATLKDNGPFEMMTTMPSRQTMSCVRWGLHSVEWNYDDACMGLDLTGYTPRDQHWEIGLTVASILVDDFLPSACVLLRLASLHVGLSAGP